MISTPGLTLAEAGGRQGGVWGQPIEAGFHAEDAAEDRNATRADRISSIYAAMKSEKRRGVFQETAGVQQIELQYQPQPRKSLQRAAPSFRVPVFRARGRHMS